MSGNGLAVEVEGLEKSFGSVRALDGIDFSVPEGTVLGLLGPNGAGKTTAVRILTTLLRPDRGRASVLGVDVVRDPERVRTVIGLTGQYAAVDEHLTGMENLVMVGRLFHLDRQESRRRADELLERFGLTDAGGRTVKTYSGGMRRRLDLAASLVNRPRVLFLDEPTTGLDPASRLGLWEMMGELVREGTTLLLTTQYLEEADRLADRIDVIDHGRLIASGTPRDLKAQIGGEFIDLHVGRKKDVRTALGALEHLTTGEGRSDRDAKTVSIPVRDGTKLLPKVVRALDEADVVITDLSVHQPTLDDVFLSLTGKPVTEDEEVDA